MTHTFDVFIMNSDGTGQTKLFTNGSAAYVCGDSTTGTIAFNSNGNPLGTNPTRDFEIFTMKIDGTNVRQVTRNTVLDSGPKWSPGCTTISYNSLDSGNSLDIHRINADGSGDVNLTNTPGVFDAFSAWSPDGTRIVFSSNRDVNFEIYTMDAANGASVQRLTFTRKRSRFPTRLGHGSGLLRASDQQEPVQGRRLEGLPDPDLQRPSGVRLLRAGGRRLALWRPTLPIAPEAPGGAPVWHGLSRPAAGENGKQPKGATLRMSLLGASAAARPRGQRALPGKVNDLRGNDRSKWQTDIPTPTGVSPIGRSNPGVDVAWPGNQGRLEYDFIVRRGGSRGDRARL